MKFLTAIAVLIVMAGMATTTAKASPGPVGQNFNLTISGIPISVTGALGLMDLVQTSVPGVTVPTGNLNALFNVLGEPGYQFDYVITFGAWNPNPGAGGLPPTDVPGTGSSLTGNNLTLPTPLLNFPVQYVNDAIVVPVGCHGIWVKTVTITVNYSAGWI